MNKLDEILKSKNQKLEIRAKEAADREINRKATEKFRQTELDEALKRKEIEKVKSRELERISTANRRKKEIVKSAFENAQVYGFIGLICGAVFGFGKGCISYGDSAPTASGYKSFLEPFIYIPGNALFVGIIGVIIGILVGINKGQNS